MTDNTQSNDTTLLVPDEYITKVGLKQALAELMASLPSAYSDKINPGDLYTNGGTLTIVLKD